MLQVVALLALTSLPAMAAGLEPGVYEITGGSGGGYNGYCDCTIDWFTPIGQIVWSGHGGLPDYGIENRSFFETGWALPDQYLGGLYWAEWDAYGNALGGWCWEAGACGGGDGLLSGLFWRDSVNTDTGILLSFDGPQSGTWSVSFFYPESASGTFTFQQVESYVPTPEPGTFSLAGAALLGLGLARIWSRSSR